MNAIRNIETGKLLTDSNGDAELFACAEDAEAELTKFDSITGGERMHEVVDVGGDIEPEPLSDLEIKVAEAIGRRL